MNDAMISFIVATLDDDHGINEGAWSILWDIYGKTGNPRLYEILQKVERQDERIYLPEDVDIER